MDPGQIEFRADGGSLSYDAPPVLKFATSGLVARNHRLRPIRDEEGTPFGSRKRSATADISLDKITGDASAELACSFVIQSQKIQHPSPTEAYRQSEIQRLVLETMYASLRRLYGWQELSPFANSRADFGPASGSIGNV